MGPERIASKARQNQMTSERRETSRKHGSWKKQNAQDAAAAELPGVQKLKAALRQTRRLLAKDNLAADVRVATERRLKSLESDLQTAELKPKERAIAKRYHKVKFFERRKVLRKIKRLRKKLEQGEAASSRETATHLENALFELRAQLNYILNYPKLEKYISLFPPSDERDERNPDLSDSVRPPKSETEGHREELLNAIKHQMTIGELSREPELEMENDASSFVPANQPARLEIGGQHKPVVSGAPTSLNRTKGRMEASRSQGPGRQDKAARVEEDDFFDSISESDAVWGRGRNSSMETSDVE